MADRVTVATDVVGLGPFVAQTEDLATLPGADVNKNGVILHNERRKVIVMHDDRPITYTVSVYIAREALDDNEARKVDAAGKEQATKKAERDQKVQDDRQRDIKSSFELGQSSLLGAMKHIDTLTGAVRTIAKLG